MSNRPLRIAMIGTRGVPAQYGGFETAVEEIGWRLADQGHEIIVYSRNPKQKLTSHRGMKVVNLPAIRSKTLETLSHSGLSTARAIIKDRPDVAFVFNSANAPYIPLLKAAGIPVAVHVDGLEASRAKWEGWGAKYYRWAEPQAVRSADAVIADAKGIQDHVRAHYGIESVFIPYGAPHPATDSDLLVAQRIEPKSYVLIVARFEPENHVLEAVTAFHQSVSDQKLLVVGSAPYANEYLSAIESIANSDPRIRMVGHLADQKLLDQMYANASAYIHGHSVGGTNPSLLRAGACSLPIMAWDSVFNREVMADEGRYWRSIPELMVLLADVTSLSSTSGASLMQRYSWDDVAHAYEVLAMQLASTRMGRRT